MESPADILNEEISPTEKSSVSSFITSITNEWKPNSYINQSVCGSTWHEYYIEDSPDITLESSDCKCSSFSKLKICKYETKYTELVKKYYSDTKKLKDKVKELSDGISIAFKENEKLRHDLYGLQQDFSLEIQNIQARHQQKLLRTKVDLDSLVKSLDQKMAEKFKKENEEIIRNLQNSYEEKIQALKEEHEFEIFKIQENMQEDLVKDLREKLKHELESVYTIKIQELSTQYDERIRQFKKEKALSKCINTKKVLIVNNEPLDNEHELREKLNSYEKHIQELQSIITIQEKNILDMSSSLTSSFKKKQPSFSPSQLSQVLSAIQ